jgi:beta-glucosidase
MRAVLLSLVLAVLGVPPGARGDVLAPDVPYTIGGPLPAQIRSPTLDPRAPYTPLVRSLIRQLDGSGRPTVAAIANAAKLFQGIIGAARANSSCAAVGGVDAPAGTRPSIASMCWADAVGVNLISGPNQGRTTATPEPLAVGSSFDPSLANAWGQVEGLEGRRLMVTGLYGPEADVSIYPNWERGLDTLGEDPYVNGVLSAAQVSGLQGRGLMAQVKHLAGFTGANRHTLTQVRDQPLHELLLAPFEPPLRSAKAASTMCAYEEYQDTSTHLAGPQNTLAAGRSPYSTGPVRTWPLNEAHWACEQPLALSFALRRLWHSVGFVGSDYPATHSAAAVTQGESQEFFIPTFFAASDPKQTVSPVVSVGNGTDPTGDTCEVGRSPAACSMRGARHVGGIPGLGCPPDNGCGLVNAVATGALPLAVFNQALAEMLYQEQRFGLLGCDQTPRARTCTNPGGVGGDRSGRALLPRGPARGATAAANLGTENGDAAVVERLAEEGAVLLKDRNLALPLTARGLRRGVAVTGPGAEYLIGAPSDEASTGFPDRISVSPLRQLKSISADRDAFSYTAAQSPTGEPVPAAELGTQAGSGARGLSRTQGPGSPRVDAGVDFTSVSPAGRLAAGDYTWNGYVNVPRRDSYTFRFQSTPAAAVTFSLDGHAQALSAPPSFYCGQYYPSSPVCVPVASTNAGYTEGGLTSQQGSAAELAPGSHAVTITFHAPTSASLRFAYSRASGDLADAAAAARGKAAALVFVNDNGVPTVDQDSYTPPSQGVASLPTEDTQLIDAVAAANPNTIVVMNTADPVIVKPWIDNPHVRAVLQMWNAGSEGGTATARLLLGRANPSGHTVLTWPRLAQDTIWGHREQRPLYPGERIGTHPERLNGLTDRSAANCGSYVPPPSPCTKTVLTEGIFSGYRYYDRERLAPEFAFGYGLSYTSFRFSRPTIKPTHGGLDVTFSVTNTGRRAGAEVAQVYVGNGPPLPGVQQAPRALRGFRRVALAPGRTWRGTISLDARSFQFWDERGQRWRTDPGNRVIWVGDADSPQRLPLRVRVRLTAR